MICAFPFLSYPNAVFVPYTARYQSNGSGILTGRLHLGNMQHWISAKCLKLLRVKASHIGEFSGILSIPSDMDTSCQRCLTPHSEALQQGRDPGPVSLMLTLCFAHDITVSIPDDPAAGCSACVSCSDAGDRNAQLHLCQSDLLSIFTLFLPSFLLLPRALWEFSPSQRIINVHEHLPHCVSWHVCACVAKFSLLQGFSLCMREACWGGCVYACTWVGVNSI